MADQCAVRAPVGIQQKRDVVDQQLAIRLRHHPGGQRMGAHQRVQGGGVGFFEVLGQVGHGVFQTGSHSTSVLTELAM